MEHIKIISVFVLVVFLASILNVPNAEAKRWWEFWKKDKKDKPPPPQPIEQNPIQQQPPKPSCTDNDFNYNSWSPDICPSIGKQTSSWVSKKISCLGEPTKYALERACTPIQVTVTDIGLTQPTPSNQNSQPPKSSIPNTQSTQQSFSQDPNNQQTGADKQTQQPTNRVTVSQDANLPACSVNDLVFSYSAFSECQPDGFRTRTYTKNTGVNCNVDESLLLLKEKCTYIPNTTPKPSPQVCLAVCRPLYELSNDCKLNSCGSGCGADNIQTFKTELECKAKRGATPICTDTDGGNNIFQKGATIGPQNGKVFTKTDVCTTQIKAEGNYWGDVDECTGNKSRTGCLALPSM